MTSLQPGCADISISVTSGRRDQSTTIVIRRFATCSSTSSHPLSSPARSNPDLRDCQGLQLPREQHRDLNSLPRLRIILPAQESGQPRRCLRLRRLSSRRPWPRMGQLECPHCHELDDEHLNQHLGLALCDDHHVQQLLRTLLPNL